MQSPRILSNNKGFSLLLVVVMFVAVGAAAYGAISLYVKLQQTNQGSVVTEQQVRIDEALRTYYRGHQTLPNPTSVPVDALGLNNKDKFDPWGQKFAYAFNYENAWGGQNKANIEGLSVNGNNVAGVLVSSGPNQTFDSFNTTTYQTYLTDPVNNTPPTTYPDTGFAPIDDIIYPINVLSEAKEIAQEQMETLRRKINAYYVANAAKIAQNGLVLPNISTFGLSTQSMFDPWGNAYNYQNQNGISSSDGSFLPFFKVSGGNDLPPVAAAGGNLDTITDDGNGNKTIDFGGGAFTGDVKGDTTTNSDDTPNGSGSSLSFDGDGDIVEINLGNSLPLTNNISILAWAKPSTVSANMPVVIKGDDGINSTQWEMITTTGGKAAFQTWQNDKTPNDRGVESTQALPTDNWTHLAATFASGSWKFYWNGTLDWSETTADTLILPEPADNGANPNDNKLLIGGINRDEATASRPDMYWQGLLDNILIYDRVLSECEIDAIYSGIPSPGMTMWLKANKGVTKGGSNNVSLWKDQSCNNNNAEQATSNNQPLYVDSALNGKPVLRFDGSNDFMEAAIADSALDSKDGVTVFMVLNSKSTINKIALTGYVSGLKASFRVQQYPASSPKWLTGAYDTTWRSSSKAVSTSDTKVIYASVFDGTQAADADKLKLWINGSQETLGSFYTTPATTTGAISKVIVGDWISDNPDTNNPFNWNGDIAEVIVYNRALSNAERQTVESYLDSKYTQVPTKVLHLQADAGVENDASGTAATNGQTVYKWADQSGKGNDATQTSASKRPTYVENAINGKPVIRFDGSDDSLEATIADGLLDSFSGSTVIAVLKTEDITNNKVALSGSVSSSNASFRIQQYKPGSTLNWLTGAYDNVWRDSSTAVKANKTIIHSTVFDGTQADANKLKLWINGTSKALSGGSGTPSTTTGGISKVIIGNWITGNYNWDGDIAEIIIYNKALSDAEREKIENELKAKYFYLTYDSQTTYGGAGDQKGRGVAINDTALFVTGNGVESGTTTATAFLAKYNLPPTALAWNKSITQGTNFDGIAVDSNGVYTVGYNYDLTTDGAGGKERKSILAKYNLDGSSGGATLTDSAWYATPNFYPSPEYDGDELSQNLALVTESRTNYIYAVGYGQNSGSTSTSVVYKHDTSGNYVNMVRDTTGSYSADVTSLGKYIYTAGHDNGFSAIWKYNSSLAEQLQITEASAGQFRGITAADNYIYAVGNKVSGTNGGSDALVCKYNELGSRQWGGSCVEWGGSSNEDAYAVAVVGDTLYVTGETSSFGSGGKDTFLLEIDASDGTIISEKFWGGTNDDSGRDVVVSDSDIYVVGETNNGTNKDVMILRYIKNQSRTPIASWNFDEGAGQSVADSSVNNYTGQLGSTAGVDANDPTWIIAAGKSGNALSFDGTNDTVIVNNFKALPRFTFSAWIIHNGPDPGAGYDRILSLTNYNFEIGKDSNGRLKVYCKGIGREAWFDTGYNISTSTWTHLAFVYDGSKLTIYANGSLIYTVGSVSQTLPSSNWHFGIGYNNVEAANIKLDEVSVYDEALSTEEISILAGVSLPTYGPAAAWYLDDGSGQTAADNSGNNHTGQLGSTSGGDSDDPTWIAGKSGNALSFDGIDDVLKVGAVPAMSTFTLSYWIIHNGADPGAGYDRISSLTGDYFETAKDSNGLLKIYFNGTWHTTTYNISSTTWTHLAFVYDGSTLTVYAGGNSVYTINASTTLPSANWYFGKRLNGAGEASTIKLDQILLYDRALTPGEVNGQAGN